MKMYMMMISSLLLTLTVASGTKTQLNDDQIEEILQQFKLRSLGLRRRLPPVGKTPITDPVTGHTIKAAKKAPKPIQVPAKSRRGSLKGPPPPRSPRRNLLKGDRVWYVKHTPKCDKDFEHGTKAELERQNAHFFNTCGNCYFAIGEYRDIRYHPRTGNPAEVAVRTDFDTREHARTGQEQIYFHSSFIWTNINNVWKVEEGDNAVLYQKRDSEMFCSKIAIQAPKPQKVWQALVKVYYMPEPTDTHPHPIFLAKAKDIQMPQLNAPFKDVVRISRKDKMTPRAPVRAPKYAVDKKVCWRSGTMEKADIKWGTIKSLDKDTITLNIQTDCGNNMIRLGKHLVAFNEKDAKGKPPITKTESKRCFYLQENKNFVPGSGKALPYTIEEGTVVKDDKEDNVFLLIKPQKTDKSLWIRREDCSHSRKKMQEKLLQCLK